MPKVLCPEAGLMYGRFKMDEQPYLCLDCNSEFFVFAKEESESAPIYFCPYCGADIDDDKTLEIHSHLR